MAFFDFSKRFFKRTPKEDFEESESMKAVKEQLIKEKEKVKELERNLEKQRLEERRLKVQYQHDCKHKKLIAPKKYNSSDDNFNEYYAKCDFCSAQIFDYYKALNYLSTLNDQLSKMPKVIELLKIIRDGKNSNETAILNKTIDYMSDIMKLKEALISEYNEEAENILKEKIINKNK